jgi:membrane fusion protein, multidrug efflux system
MSEGDNIKERHYIASMQQHHTGQFHSRFRPLLRSKWFYIVLAIAAAGWWWFGGASSGGKNVTPAVRVTVAQVKREDVPDRVSLVGTVVAYETVAVKSRLDSQVTNVLFKDGDYVKEGQVLFELDDRTVKAQLKEMEAGVEKEKAQLVNLRLQYERAQKLLKTNTVAQAQVDTARAAYEAQLAQVNAMQASLDTASVQLTYTTIAAPISGRAGTINVTRGNNVRANDTQPLVTINQISPIRVQFSIPQRYYDQIRNVMSVGSMTVLAQRDESKEAAAEGTLEYLDNAIDVSNGTFAARAKFPNEDEKLWPGMFVNVSLELGVDKSVLTVPGVALQGDEGNRFVFVADKERKKAIRMPVEVAKNNGEVAIIANGISEGDEVIVDGLLRVTDGGPIEVAPPAGSKSSEDEGKAP